MPKIDFTVNFSFKSKEDKRTTRMYDAPLVAGKAMLRFICDKVIR